ncbi:twin-arginine translocase TatA/TatE family subunit [Wenzhouxiangella sp. XN201]|uniref:twin-arginine translocase TatA/TatE family subunit n=1 Tax=Wenzhouxiangella sp. XN201 TaxID=2710755 RepID=UPI0013CC02B4|nr:twin-arginine translocase TatA/TatE family subunit [Wenzhouxiangella sp. XN201]NEZ04442.1 twin-arginine translocase TatA/TatE family subunit [Wenzhouxiangella sp. XN201]
MGISGISLPQILIILLIVLLIFGTKRIRNIGSDLGGAIREFRQGVRDDDDKEDDSQQESGDKKSAEETRKRSASDPDS